MPTSRPFAYNPGPQISGTTQVGSLAVGIPITGFTDNPKFWNGPDEELGYVIAASDSSNRQPTPIFGVTASVGFYRTNSFLDLEFVNLAQYISSRTFYSAVEASVWLTNNGYWNSYPAPVLSLDAGNTNSYPGTGTVWTDLVGGKTFSLINGPAYRSSNGGLIEFTASSGQYAISNTSLSSLNTWSVAVWHYWNGDNTLLSPCIVTEKWPNSTGQLNFSIGNNSDTSPALQAGFFNGAWRNTPTDSLQRFNWYYIVGTYDGDTIKLYVNNRLAQSAVYQGKSASGGEGIILMRRWDDPPGGFWGGSLATVNIYNGALTANQIDYFWTSTKSRFGL